MLLISIGQATAQADVTAVKGSAYGYSCVVSAFETPCTPSGPTPAVTLATDGSNSPQAASSISARADSGPATIFSSGRLDVSTQGTLGPSGSVTSSTNIANVNASGQENFTASNLASTCTASETGRTGSTTISSGTLQTDNGDSDPTNSIPDHAPVEVALSASPIANTTYDGHVHIGNTTDSFSWVFNEKTVNADGSITVRAAHEYLLGPVATGNLILGQVVCGVTPAGDTTPPTVSAPSVDFRLKAVGTSAAPVPVRVSFTATDTSGISATALQQSVNGGTSANVTLPSVKATAVNLSLAPSSTTTRRFQAGATDNAGNVSDFVPGPTFTLEAYQDGGAGVTQTSIWSSQSSSSFFGGTVRYASAAGARQSLTVTGTDFALVSTRGPNRGRAEVWVDGVKKKTLDLYGSTTLYRRVVYAISFASPGAHTIELRVLGTKNASSSGKRVDFDAFLTMEP